MKHWLDSGAEIPNTHPSEERFAAYVAWLLQGAHADCPSPAVRTHVGECIQCYQQAEDLLVAHLAAHREERPASFVLRLGNRLEDSMVVWQSEAGQISRRPLALLSLHALSHRAPPGLQTEERLAADLLLGRGEVPEAGNATALAVFPFRSALESEAAGQGAAPPPEDQPALELDGVLVHAWARARMNAFDLLLLVQDWVTTRNLPDTHLVLQGGSGQVLREDRTRQGLVFWPGIAPGEYTIQVLV